MVDELLVALNKVSVQLLPILGAVALIFLCVFFRKLWLLIDNITLTVKNIQPTIKLVDQSIEKVQAPLNTAVKLSGTIDNVHDKTVESVNKAATYVNENMDTIKSKINDQVENVKKVLKKEDKNDEQG